MIFYYFFWQYFFGVIYVKIWKKSVLFYLGGSIYMALELLWRGRTHGSMFLAGGTCFLLIRHQGELPNPFPVPVRAMLGAGIVTMVELSFGLLANRSYQVWDYRNQPGNLWGQICPLFSLLWIPVSLAAILLYDRLNRKIGAFM